MGIREMVGGRWQGITIWAYFMYITSPFFVYTSGLKHTMLEWDEAVSTYMPIWCTQEVCPIVWVPIYIMELEPHILYVYTLLFATSGVWLGTGGSLTSVRWNIHQHRYCKDGSLFTQHIRFAPDKANHAQNFILPWKHSTPHMWHYGERNALPCTSMVAMEYRETFCWHSQRRNPHS